MKKQNRKKKYKTKKEILRQLDKIDAALLHAERENQSESHLQDFFSLGLLTENENVTSRISEEKKGKKRRITY